MAIGTAVGVPAARQVKMTQMPQMVALFNGVGGGAVALIAWVEFRDLGRLRRRARPTWRSSRCFAAIVGSVSFWGSNIAFAKLQELICGKPISRSGALQTPVNALLGAVAVGCGVAIVAGADDEILIIAAAGRRGGCSATCWCCRSAAPTCRSSSRCSTRSPA